MAKAPVESSDITCGIAKPRGCAYVRMPRSFCMSYQGLFNACRRPRSLIPTPTWHVVFKKCEPNALFRLRRHGVCRLTYARPLQCEMLLALCIGPQTRQLGYDCGILERRAGRTSEHSLLLLP